MHLFLEHFCFSQYQTFRKKSDKSNLFDYKWIINYDCLNLYFKPYSSSLLYSVVRPIPSSSAATLRFPFACFNARKTRSLSSASLRRAKLTGEVALVTASSRCSFVTRPVCACNTAAMIF